MTPSTPEFSPTLLNRLLFRILSIPAGGPEISDLIIAFDNDKLERRPISRAELVQEFESRNSRRAARIVEQMPVNHDGELDEKTVDALLVRVHCEMQRLSEEFQHGRRMAQLLNPLLYALRETDPKERLRVVDIGCGTGY